MRMFSGYGVSTIKIPLKVRVLRIVLELAAFALSLLPAFLTLYLTDEMIERGKRIPGYWLVLAVALCFFVHLFQFYFSRYKGQVYSNRVAENYRRELAQKISRSQPFVYEKEPKSRVFNLINDMNPVYTLANYLICVPVDVIEIIVVICILFHAHCGLGVVALLMAPLYLFSSYLNKGRLEHLVGEERKRLDGWQREVDTILNWKVSIGLNRSWSYMLERYRNALADFYQTQNRKHFFLLLTQQLPRLITTLAPLMILIVGGNLAADARISLGTLLFALQFVAYLFAPLGDIAMVQADLMSQRANFRRAGEFMELPEQAEEFPEGKKLVIENVMLRRQDRSVLYRIPELTLPDTGLIVIKGENGCGKSTLFHLLSGVFSKEQAEIEKDGRLQVPPDFRKNLDYLFYPAFLFQGTVKGNILCGHGTAPGVYEKVEKLLDLPPGDKKVVTKPENLSLGEKQKIFLARILVNDRKIFLLDEPGSNLDDRTERSFAEELGRRKKEKLILIISHNQIYDEIADQIYRIQDQVMRRVDNAVSAAENRKAKNFPV